MFLDSLEYSQFKGQNEEWSLEKVELNDNINLIAGKNASGKTRILSIIKNIADLVSGDNKNLFISSNQYLVFKKNNGLTIKYNLEIATNSEVIKEEYFENDNCLLKRGSNGEGEIWADEIRDRIKFQTPANELACLKKRDSIQHPFLEDLYNWGKNLLHYPFGTDLGKMSAFMPNLSILQENKVILNLKDSNQVILSFREGIKIFGENFKTQVITDINSLGYSLKNITVDITDKIVTNSPMSPINVLHIEESGIKADLTQFDLSQGMFRALSLIIQLNFAKLTSTPSCILIDDIGEGLDFERSTSLIKLLIEKVKRSNIQLIMSTNDRFVMNNIPLEYWQIIQRNGSKCKLLNYKNSKEIFDEFKFTGLNNFDFFSTEFYLGGSE